MQGRTSLNKGRRTHMGSWRKCAKIKWTIRSPMNGVFTDGSELGFTQQVHILTTGSQHVIWGRTQSTWTFNQLQKTTNNSSLLLATPPTLFQPTYWSGKPVSCVFFTQNIEQQIFQIAVTSVSMQLAFYILISVCGYLSFVEGTQRNIIMNYANSDVFAIISRSALTLTLLFALPINLNPTLRSLLRVAWR